MRRAGSLCAGLLVVATLLPACGPRRLQLPSGDGEPFPDFSQAAAEATAGCRQVRSLSAELGISGRAGGQKLRGRATTGIAAPDSIRLEGTAPFGPPVFILAANRDASVLLLPRDHRVVTGEAPADILESLVGLEINPSDLLALLSGCVVPDPQPSGGRLFPNGWARVDVQAGTSLFLQRDARRQWRVGAGTGRGLRVEHERDAAGELSAVRISLDGDPQRATDLRITVSQVEHNVPLGPEVFRLNVPADAQPLSLSELRQAGPMGERR